MFVRNWMSDLKNGFSNYPSVTNDGSYCVTNTLRGRQWSHRLSSSSHRQDCHRFRKNNIWIQSWFEMFFFISTTHMCERHMCLCITHPDVQTESFTHKMAFLFNISVSRVCSTPCVTNLWSSCPIPAPADQFSTSRRTTSSSSRPWCTKRRSSYRSYCLDTTWSVCAECQTNVGVGCVVQSHEKSRSFLHIRREKIDWNTCS